MRQKCRRPKLKNGVVRFLKWSHRIYKKNTNIRITLCMDFKYPLFRMKNIVEEIKIYRYISFKRKFFFKSWNKNFSPFVSKLTLKSSVSLWFMSLSTTSAMQSFCNELWGNILLWPLFDSLAPITLSVADEYCSASSS